MSNKNLKTKNKTNDVLKTRTPLLGVARKGT